MNRLRNFMQGRYGTDRLNQTIMALSIILLVFQFFFKSTLLYYLVLALIILTYYRCFSKNFQKRYAENQKFLLYWNPIEKWFRIKWKQIKDFRTHRYFKCTQCKQYIRVPRKKGTIQVRCPKCSYSFQART